MDDIQKELLTTVSTKLDILIGDFKELRLHQDSKWKEFSDHIVVEERDKSKVDNTILWHDRLGKGAILAAISFSIFLYYYIKEIEIRTNRLEANGAYYYKNREVTIKLIEDYKRENGL